jgi:hypothetical protein
MISSDLFDDQALSAYVSSCAEWLFQAGQAYQSKRLLRKPWAGRVNPSSLETADTIIDQGVEAT